MFPILPPPDKDDPITLDEPRLMALVNDGQHITVAEAEALAFHALHVHAQGALVQKVCSELAKRTADAPLATCRSCGKFIEHGHECEGKRPADAQTRRAVLEELRATITRMMGDVCASCRDSRPMGGYNVHRDGFPCESVRYRDIMWEIDKLENWHSIVGSRRRRRERERKRRMAGAVDTAR